MEERRGVDTLRVSSVWGSTDCGTVQTSEEVDCVWTDKGFRRVEEHEGQRGLKDWSIVS